MRADAVRRREAITREARRLFAAHGSSVALEAVAEAAGVGIATLYRNFPSRADLIDAVIRSSLDDIAADAERALAAFEVDPERAWSSFLDSLVDLDLGALTDALSHTSDDLSDDLRRGQTASLAAVGRVLARAQEHGLVGDRFSALEIVLAIGVLARPQPGTVRELAPDLGHRLVAIFASGLRP